MRFRKRRFSSGRPSTSDSLRFERTAAVRVDGLKSIMPVDTRPDLLQLKPGCWDKNFKTMCDAAERVREAAAGGGARAFTPKDLELFEANDYMKKSCYRRYDKVTNAPDHGELPAWNIPAWRVAKYMAKG